MVKRSIEQEIRNKNFGARSGNFEKNAVVKNQGTKQRVQRILGDCWQWETNGQCVKGNNCSFRHDMDKRGKSSPSNPSQNSFMQQGERKPSRTRSPRGKSPSGRMSRWDYLRGRRRGRMQTRTSWLSCQVHQLEVRRCVRCPTSGHESPATCDRQWCCRNSHTEDLGFQITKQ